MERTTQSLKSARLSPVSYVVLGFADHNETMTSYDLKHKVESSVGYVWPFPHTQLYDEPKRLAGLGLLSESVEDGGRRRRMFTITDAGRAALNEWLNVPATNPTRIQDLGLLQLFFAATSDRTSAEIQERLRSIAKTQIAAHQERMEEYQEIGRRISAGQEAGELSVGGCSYRALTVGMGMEKLMIEFWEGVIEDPPSHC
jgi:DNA-binding PadR family transcriptional regulator